MIHRIFPLSIALGGCASGVIIPARDESVREPTDTADAHSGQPTPRSCADFVAPPCDCEGATPGVLLPTGTCACDGEDPAEFMRAALPGVWEGTATAPEGWPLTPDGLSRVDVQITLGEQGDYESFCLTEGCPSATVWGIDGASSEKTWAFLGVITTGGVAELRLVWDNGVTQTADVEAIAITPGLDRLTFDLFAPWQDNAGPVAYDLQRCGDAL